MFRATLLKDIAPSTESWKCQHQVSFRWGFLVAPDPRIWCRPKMCPGTYWWDNDLQTNVFYKVVHMRVQVQIQVLPSRSLTISHETMANLLCCNLTCSFLECIGEACVPRGPSHLLFLFLPTWIWILFLPLPPLSLFLKASFVAAHLLHDSAVCLTFGWKIELHHQPTTTF